MVKCLPSIEPSLFPNGRALTSAVQPGCIPHHPLFPRTSENRAQLVPTSSLNHACKNADHSIPCLHTREITSARLTD